MGFALLAAIIAAFAIIAIVIAASVVYVCCHRRRLYRDSSRTEADMERSMLSSSVPSDVAYGLGTPSPSKELVLYYLYMKNQQMASLQAQTDPSSAAATAGRAGAPPFPVVLPPEKKAPLSVVQEEGEEEMRKFREVFGPKLLRKTSGREGEETSASSSGGGKEEIEAVPSAAAAAKEEEVRKFREVFGPKLLRKTSRREREGTSTSDNGSGGKDEEKVVRAGAAEQEERKVPFFYTPPDSPLYLTPTSSPLHKAAKSGRDGHRMAVH